MLSVWFFLLYIYTVHWTFIVGPFIFERFLATEERAAFHSGLMFPSSVTQKSWCIRMFLYHILLNHGKHISVVHFLCLFPFTADTWLLFPAVCSSFPLLLCGCWWLVTTSELAFKCGEAVSSWQSYTIWLQLFSCSNHSVTTRGLVMGVTSSQQRLLTSGPGVMRQRHSQWLYKP